MTVPIVSVVMSVYNQEQYIAASIDSVLSQTYSDFELVVVDDGSTDGSMKIVREYDDPRIKVFSNPKNMGIVATSNHGLRVSRGKYIARLDSDDIAHPERLEKQVSFLDSNDHVMLLGAWHETLESPPKAVCPPTESNFLADALMIRNFFAHSSVMYRREVFDSLGVFYPEVAGGAEDYAFYLKVLRHAAVANLPTVLLYYRVHDSQISHQQKVLQAELAAKERDSYVEFRLGRKLDDQERYLHGLFCSNAALSRDDLKSVGAWSVKLRRESAPRSNAIEVRLRERYRASARIHGPAVWKDYFVGEDRTTSVFEDIGIAVVTVGAWLRQRLNMLWMQKH